MELRHLRYFCAVAERRSFTLAARHLHVSQSGVSGQVRDLEQEIGATLLRRNQREISLTPEGAIFFREAQQILALADRAVELTQRASQGQFGTLAVGLCGPATAPFLPAIVRQFRTLQPGVALTLTDLDPSHQPAALQARTIDVGFTRQIPPSLRHVLRSEVFYREPLIAAFPEAHPLMHKPSIDLSQLAAERFVLYSREAAPDLFDIVTGLCRRAKFSPRVVGTPSIWQSVLTLVEAGEGVSLIPACVRQLRSKGVAFRQLQGRKCLLDVILAWRRNDSDGIRDGFLDLLRSSRSVIREKQSRDYSR